MRVSVAMTCFNGSNYIIEQLESLRNQTRKIDEVRIIDDHSTDGSFQLVEDYIRAHNLKDWKVVSNPENLGWIKNFHKDIAQTNGDIVFFCDQDDVWHENKIERMTEILSTDENISVLVCRLNLIDSDGKRLPDMHEGLPFDSKNTGKILKNKVDAKFLYTISPGCTMAVKRKLITELYKIDQATELPHDNLFWKVGTCLDCAYILDEALIDYRIHSNNASNPSAVAYRSVKTNEQRLDEVKRYRNSILSIRNILSNLTINDSYNQIIDSIEVFLTNREKWLKKTDYMNTLVFFFKGKKYYRNMKMFIGDLLARNR